ncbi:hypothetical protein [Streptomyces sp. NPDC059071]|uniref:hypothetical protein n=1 Tax=unclassified Streptomyces TaxID=2593676 RepID=UPI0036474D24
MTDQPAFDLETVLPAWEANYEPGNVSDYLIGYANSEAAAKGAAIAWVTSQTDKDPASLEWVEMPTGDQHDHWYDLIQNHDDGIPTDTGVNVRHRLPTAGIRDAARQATGQPAAAGAPQYGVDGCTCRPWTNRGDGARWCTPDDTVDMVAGWDPGPGCPRHPAAGLAAPTNHNTEDRRRLAAVERLCSGRPGYHTVTVKQLLTAMSDAAGAES